MEDVAVTESETDLQAQLILLAASHHNLESLRPLLRTGSASVQDPESGFTPLHAAIAACDPTSENSSQAQHGSAANTAPNGHINGNTNGEQNESEDPEMEAAIKTVRLLLQNGAIWNDVDKNNETPGCVALRLGLKELYEIMVDAGVRAEILLNRLDEYQQLADTGDSEDDIEDELEVQAGQEATPEVAEQQAVNSHVGTTPMGSATTDPDLSSEPKNEDYLQSTLRFQDSRILDNDNNGVMMAWETSIMKHTADLLVPKPELRILNIGHGMGIIDTFFQEKAPSFHHIIEAHPAVLARMKEEGWYNKPHVTIHEGRWQDVVPKIMEQGLLFDAIFFDTFAEGYKALHDFFSDSVLGLLEDKGKWGFFNGLGADRQICYDVYRKVVEMDLFEAGFDTEWETIEVPKMDDAEWEGVKRRYWALDEYKLPICEFIG